MWPVPLFALPSFCPTGVPDLTVSVLDNSGAGAGAVAATATAAGTGEVKAAPGPAIRRSGSRSGDCFTPSSAPYRFIGSGEVGAEAGNASPSASPLAPRCKGEEGTAGGGGAGADDCGPTPRGSTRSPHWFCCPFPTSFAVSDDRARSGRIGSERGKKERTPMRR